MFILRFLFKLFAVFILIGGIGCAISHQWAGAIAGGIFFILLWRVGTKRRKDNWRDDRASNKQKSFADELGIKYKANISKGDLSDLISERTGR